MHRFVLQAIDPDLGCSVLEAMLRVADLEALRSLLTPDALEDADLDRDYFLHPADLQAINKRFGARFDPGGRECLLSRHHPIRDAPYLIHTNYELALMLNGVKPFAKFTDEYPEGSDKVTHSLFEPHVRSGRLFKRVVDDLPFKHPVRLPDGRTVEGTRSIYYARCGEEWRIDAHLLLLRQTEHSGWNETWERLEGSLLGYTDAQNDWWIAHRHRHYTATAYVSQRNAGNPAPLKGGCACGHVRYRLESAPIIVHGCHCRYCQRISGSAFAVNAMIEADRVALIGEGGPEVVETPSALPAGQRLHRCPRCRVALWSNHSLFGGRVAFIYAGTLDEGEWVVPDVHCFTASRHPWVAIPAGVPAFEGNYDHTAVWSAEAAARLAAALRS